MNAEELTKKLVDAGKIIEGGWVAFAAAVIPKDAPPVQHTEMRNAFFAGAQHLWGSIISVLDPGAEPTEKDLLRMDLIQQEMEAYVKELKSRLNQKPKSHENN